MASCTDAMGKVSFYLSVIGTIGQYIHEREDEGPGALLNSPFWRYKFGGEDDNGDDAQS